jgi:hypothetical protein
MGDEVAWRAYNFPAWELKTIKKIKKTRHGIQSRDTTEKMYHTQTNPFNAIRRLLQVQADRQGHARSRDLLRRLLL